MIQINERSTAVLSMTFTDENKAPVTPSSARYCVLDEMSGTILTDWTPFSPAGATYNLTIDQSNNQIIDEERTVEVRVITIIFQYNSGTKQCANEFKYEVKNLFCAPAGIVLACSGGFIVGGACALT